MASDLISRDALVKAILAERDKIPLEVVPRYGFGVPVPERHGQSMRGGIRKALHCVETATAVDAVEVVRCNECKRGEPSLIRNGEILCAWWRCHTHCNGFCHMGVKKDAVD